MIRHQTSASCQRNFWVVPVHSCVCMPSIYLFYCIYFLCFTVSSSWDNLYPRSFSFFTSLIFWPLYLDLFNLVNWALLFSKKLRKKWLMHVKLWGQEAHKRRNPPFAHFVPQEFTQPIFSWFSFVSHRMEEAKDGQLKVCSYLVLMKNYCIFTSPNMHIPTNDKTLSYYNMLHSSPLKNYRIHLIC